MSSTDQWTQESTAGIIEHMNEDHSDAVNLYLKAFGNLQVSASDIKMVAMDENGITLSYQASGSTQSKIILFADAGVKSPLTHLSEARSALVTLVGNARKKLAD